MSAASKVLFRVAAAMAMVVATLAAPAAAGAAQFTQVAPGADHTCGLRSDGTVWCWGSGSTGQLGVVAVTQSRVPIKVIGSYQTTQISSGTGFWCERQANGTALCSGANSRGQLGSGNTITSEYPQDVYGLIGVSEIRAGTKTACALIGDRVACWGDGSRGQLGNGLLADGPQPTPFAIPNLNGITDIDVGDTSACAVRNDSLVYCWGDTTDRKLGNGIQSAITIPQVPVSGLNGVQKIAVGDRHACALRVDGTVWCWGDNSSGELGDGTVAGRGTAMPVPGLTGVVQIDASGLNTCAVQRSGTVVCWGAGASGQIGNGGRATVYQPAPVSGIADAAQVGVGRLHACIVTRTQVPSCWGSNEFSQLGDGDPQGSGAASASPKVVIDSLSPAVFLTKVAAGLATRTSRGGAIQFRNLALTRRPGRSCPTTVRVTVTAKGRSATTTGQLDRSSGRCTLSGRFRLATRTTGAATASYSVRSSSLLTRKASLKLRG